MSWGGPEFVIAIIAISTFGWLASSWIRARHGYPIENEWSGMSHKADAEAAPRVEEDARLAVVEQEGVAADLADAAVPGERRRLHRR